MKKVSGTSNTASASSRHSLFIRLATAGLVLFQFMLVPVLKHNTLRAENKKIILEHSDTIEGGQNERGTYKSVTGKVVFWHNTLNLKCDRATSYDRENRIVLGGNIILSNNSFEIYGDNGVYYPDKEIGELNGNVRGQLLGKSLCGKSQKAVINKHESQIWLNENAIAWYNRQQISGDIILLHLKQSAKSGGRMIIDKIQIQGNAFFAAEDTLSHTPIAYNQLGGNKMAIQLDDNSKITGITVSGQAEGLFHLYGETREPAGINYSSGNEIRMYFREGALYRVKVAGNTEGKHYPQSYRGDTSINLPKFRWRENENPFRQEKSLQ
jgi:lipopolysaccharide export system protein LptA